MSTQETDIQHKMPGRIAKALAHISEAVFCLDENWHITYFNPSAANLVGHIGDLSGADLREILPPPLAKELEPVCRLATASQAPAEFEGALVLFEQWYIGRVYPTEDGLILCFEDITKSKKLEKQARQNEERLRVLFETSSEPNLLTDDGIIVDCNAAAVRAFGAQDKAELLLMDLLRLSPEFQPDGQGSREKSAQIRRLAREHGSYRCAWLFRRLDGAEAPVDLVLTASRPYDRELIWVEFHDAAERIRAEQTPHQNEKQIGRLEAKLREVEARDRALMQAAPLAILTIGLDKRILSWNPAAERMFGWSEAEVLNQPTPLLSQEQEDEFTALATLLRQGRGYTDRETRRRCRDGTLLEVSVSGAPLLDSEGRMIGLIEMILDITSRKRGEHLIERHVQRLNDTRIQLEQRTQILEEISTLDGLTGIKNHRAFQARLQEECERANRYHIPLALLMLDVDQFKSYNDRFGHPAGDRILKQIALILEETTRTSDFVARYGGEEFAVILPQTSRVGALEAAERIRAAVERHTRQETSMTVSIGAALLEPLRPTPQDLIAGADSALYLSKRQGRNRVTFHSPDAISPPPAS